MLFGCLPNIESIIYNSYLSRFSQNIGTNIRWKNLKDRKFVLLTSSNLYEAKKYVINEYKKCWKNNLVVDTFSHNDGVEDENEEFLFDIVDRWKTGVKPVDGGSQWNKHKDIHLIKWTSYERAMHAQLRPRVCWAISSRKHF